ncbi:hypothetical protein Tco_0167714 [Tanacetum coccineum]
MSAMANTTPIVTTVTKPATKEKTPKDADATPRVNIQDFCEEHYEDILPVIMDKIRRDKRKEVHARLDFRKSPKKRISEGSQNSSARTLSARYRNPSERLKVLDQLRYNDDQLGHRRYSAFDRLSDTYSPSTTKSGSDKANSRDCSHSKSRPHRRDSSNRDRPRSKDCSRGFEESYDNTCSSYGTGTKHGYHSRDRDRSRYVKIGRESESLLSRVSESGTSEGGHWKSKSKRHKSTDEDDLAVPWICEEVDSFTPRICNFKSSRKTRKHNNVKTYEGIGDPEDHVKVFQAAAPLPSYEEKSPLLAKRKVTHHGGHRTSQSGTLQSGGLTFKGRDQPKVGKKEVPAKDKSMAIYMIQPWHRMTRQKVTQSFEHVSEITFPSLTTSSGTEGPLVIEAKIGGHMIHRMYVDRVTIRSTILIPAECAMVITSSKEIPKEAGVRHENFKVALHPNFPDREVTIGGTLSAKGRTKLCSLLKENLDIFAWQPSDMTGVMRVTPPNGAWTEYVSEGVTS